MLLAILLISLFIYAWGQISEYQASKIELANIKDTSQFNEQFTSYDRDDVQGYELLTLIHKVIDYNERNTTDSNAGANTYPCIKLTIYMKTFGGEDRRKELTYDGRDNLLFTNDHYKDDALSAQKRNKPGSFEYDIEQNLKKAMDELIHDRRSSS